MSVQPALLDRLNSAFHHRQYMPERLTDLKSIKPEDATALYLHIMATSSASVIYKMSMPAPKVPDVL